MMHGMLVESSEGDTVVVYAESAGLRDQWVSLFQKASKAGKFVTDLYDIDVNHPLGWCESEGHQLSLYCPPYPLPPGYHNLRF